MHTYSILFDIGNFHKFIIEIEYHVHMKNLVNCSQHMVSTSYLENKNNLNGVYLIVLISVKSWNTILEIWIRFPKQHIYFFCTCSSGYRGLSGCINTIEYYRITATANPQDTLS